MERTYDLTQYLNTQDINGNTHLGRYAKTCVVYNCKEQDDSGMADAESTYHNRIMVITESCFLLFSVLPEHPSLGQLEFWATLQSMERIRRNLNCPSISAIQWRKETQDSQPNVTVLKIGETKAHADEVIKELVDRMKAMGVAYKKNVNKNFKISEREVSKGSVG